MSSSRRDFLVRTGMTGVAASLGMFSLRAFGQNPQTARLPTPAEAAVDPVLPPEATNGPWRNLRAVKDKKVVDIHTHIFESPVQGTTYHEENLIHLKNEWLDFSNQLVESMDRYGVAVSVVSPIWASYEQNQKSDWLKHRGRLVMAVSPHVDPGAAGDIPGAGHSTSLTPEKAQFYADALRQQLTDGMHVNCTTEGGVPPGWKDPMELKPIMAVYKEFDVPVMIPVSWSQTRTAVGLHYETSEGPAERFAGLATSYPDIKFIMNHMGGRVEIPDGYEAIRCAMGLDNAWVETSKSTAKMITYAVQTLGPERVLFGSDWNRPQMKTYGPKNFHSIYQQWDALNQVAGATISEDERDLILYKNARRLIHLS